MDLLGNRSLVGRTIYLAAQGTGKLFGAVESAWFGSASPTRGPLFLIGLPRAGTTLVYQALCHRYQFSYLPTLTNYVPFAPALSTWTLRRAIRNHHSDFQSQYGIASGMSSPGEGVVWNLWFQKHQHYRTLGDCPNACHRMRILMGQIERLGGGPVVNKNLRHNQRVIPLAQLFPHARFLVILRNPREVALSLLRARRETTHGTEAWFSIRPRHFPPSGPPELVPAEQVVWQVRGLLEDLKEDIEASSADRFCGLHYEAFCQDPTGTLGEVHAWLAQHGIDPEVRHDLPESFALSSATTRNLQPEEVAAVDRALAKILPESSFPLPCSSVG